MLQTTLILDFDGTIAVEDVGNALCDRFAPPEWKEVDARWERREVSLPEAQRQMWGLMRCTAQQLDAETDRVGAVRGGLDALLHRAQAGRVRLVCASGGFERYVRRILGPRSAAFDAIYANGLDFDGDRVAPTFGWLERFGCEVAAVCKGRICDHYRQAGQRVVFVGDGASDRCAIGRADTLYAVRGSKLERWAEEAGVAVVPFESFDEVVW